MSTHYTFENDQTKINYNIPFKKLTVTYKKARCTRADIYGPIPMSDVKQLVDMLKATPDRALAETLAEWENI